MSLAEKAGQLTMITGEWAVTGPRARPMSLDAIRAGEAGSILNLWSPAAVREAQEAAIGKSRLGIPLLIGFDVVHGHRTVFPVPLGEAASFDPGLWRKTAAAAADEALADGINLTFAPMLDVTRDPRWGRICEGAGEDPHVASQFAAAKVAGFQGVAGDGAIEGIAATAKHLGAYGVPLAGRDYASADVSARELEEVHLPAFIEAVSAGVAAVMPSFNDLAGLPATASRSLLDGFLRRRLGFGGIVVSDYHAIAELITHGVAADLAEAAALALRAGVDIDMMGGAYLGGLGEALARRLVSMAEIDAAVLRVLRLKERLGLFRDPYRGLGGDDPPAPRYRSLAREAGAAAMVLLKNAEQVLPLPAAGGAIAVVGPLASAPEDMMGSWSGAGRAGDSVTFADGIRAAFPGRSVVMPGDSGIAAAQAAAAAAIVFCAGETRAMSGEASCRGNPDFPQDQHELARAVLATGRPVILALCSGRPVVLPDWLVAGCAAIIACWFPGTEAGHALGDIVSGRVSPGARLPVTWPVAAGQIPIHYARRRSGRPDNPADHYTSKYLDMPVEPLFPFGHGLSYSAFSLEAASLGATELAVPGAVTVSARLRNVGGRRASTVLFLFIHDPVASLARPVIALKRFARVVAEPGEAVTVEMTLTSDDLAFPGEDMAPRVENGRIDILLGERAVETELTRLSLTVTGGLSHIAQL